MIVCGNIFLNCCRSGLLKKRQGVISFLVFILLISLGMNAKGYAKESVNFDGGLLVENRTLVPLRAIFEQLGASVDWDSKTSTVTAQKGDIQIALKVGSNETTINGVVKTIDVPAKVLDGNTFIPLRFVSEALGALVEWDETSSLATISTDEKEIYVTVRPYFELNGQNFVYDGELKNGLPHGSGIAIKGTSIYGDVYYEGKWSNGKPANVINVYGKVVEINGKTIDLELSTKIENRVLVSLREIIKEIGAELKFDPSKNLIIIKRDNQVIELQPDNKTAMINGTKFTLDVPPKVINGHTMVPISFISKQMGLEVN